MLNFALFYGAILRNKQNSSYTSKTNKIASPYGNIAS